MSARVACIGVSHKTAPVELRECLTLDDATAAALASSLLRESGVYEALAFSTCNRTELYAYAEDINTLRAVVLTRFAGRASAEILEPCVYLYSGDEAISHLFRVASSLDSMVVGEDQILSQLKTAYLAASRRATIGVVLDKLLSHALETGKRVRTQTTIGCRPVSVSSAAVELALEVFGALDECTVLVLGAGETSELTATHLRARGVRQILISNRTYESSVLIAQRFGGRAVSWGALDRHLKTADIVIASTAAPHYVVTRAEVERIMRLRKARPIFFIDIAVPRDCEPEIGEIDGVHLFDIDDLHCAVARNRGEREAEALEASCIVAEEVEKAEARLAGLEVAPTIVALRSAIESIRVEELSRTTRRLGDADDRVLREVEVFSKRFANKLLHTPSHHLKELSMRDDAYIYVDAVRHLFALDDETDDGRRPQGS